MHSICAGEHQGAEKLSIKAREEEFVLTCEMNVCICFSPTKAKGVNFSPRAAAAESELEMFELA